MKRRGGGYWLFNENVQQYNTTKNEVWVLEPDIFIEEQSKIMSLGNRTRRRVD